MIRRPPRSTLFPLHDALPISAIASAGSYYWVASYSGDHNNTEAASGCADEPVLVGQAAPEVKTAQIRTQHACTPVTTANRTLSCPFGEHTGRCISWQA